MKKLRKILSKLENHEITVEDVIGQLKKLPYEDLGFAKIDHHRRLRKGAPEVIFCEGKTPVQIAKITYHLLDVGSNVLGTRISREDFLEVKKQVPSAKYHKEARVFTIKQEEVDKNKGQIAIITAGTSDMPVAEEAAITAEFLGNKVARLYDVGIAGIHRLFMNTKVLEESQVIIVVAGMEGALASVVGGLVDKPVIAVPTSVGYGANFKGLAPLLTMLNSCASGITVVNIDNGFGAGFAAHQINKIGGLENK